MPATTVAGTFEYGLDAYERGDYATAHRFWREAADQGSRSAQFNLGVLYERGLGTGQEPTEALRWYRLAADQDDAEAQYTVGLMHERGIGTTADREAAMGWYRRAIGNPSSGERVDAIRRLARARLDEMAPPAHEAIDYDGGRFLFTVTPSGRCALALQGKITQDAPTRFNAAHAKVERAGCRETWVLLESEGGAFRPVSPSDAKSARAATAPPHVTTAPRRAHWCSSQGPSA